MKDIGLITDIPFWRKGLGQYERIQALVHYLAQHAKLTIYYVGTWTEEFSKFAVQVATVAQCVYCPQNQSSQLASYFHAAHHDKIIVEYLYLHPLCSLIPPTTDRILDAHDILSHRASSFKHYGRQAPIEVTEEVEFQLFGKFHQVMFIQADEYALGVEKLGEKHCLLCPHPVIAVEKKLQANVKTIGFLGSAGVMNQDGLIWFHDHVLPLLEPQYAVEIYGTICYEQTVIQRCPNLHFMGTVAELPQFYQKIDIVMCPILYGAGLKIKCVEALAYGVPLVTTSVGAQGLMSHANQAFLLADDIEQFANSLHQLAYSLQLRQQLSHYAHQLIRTEFTSDACFSALVY